MGPALPNINMLESDGAPTQGGNNSHFVFYGKQASAPACESVCASDTHCIAWTWHDGEQPAGSTSWDEQCYGVLTGTALSNVGETHHVSGVKTVTQPKNIYVRQNTPLLPIPILNFGNNARVGSKLPLPMYADMHIIDDSSHSLGRPKRGRCSNWHDRAAGCWQACHPSTVAER